MQIIPVSARAEATLEFHAQELHAQELQAHGEVVENESRMTPGAHVTKIVARIALCTASREEAPGIARALVERRLAACVNILPGVQSIYWWQEKVEEAAEVMLLIKTTEDKLGIIEQVLKTLNSYELPEFLVLEVEGGSDDYLRWIQSSLR